eukprot:Ihof_evm9s240 gene=Ihof_evmTU9s240
MVLMCQYNRLPQSLPRLVVQLTRCTRVTLSIPLATKFPHPLRISNHSFSIARPLTTEIFLRTLNTNYSSSLLSRALNNTKSLIKLSKLIHNPIKTTRIIFSLATSRHPILSLFFSSYLPFFPTLSILALAAFGSMTSVVLCEEDENNKGEHERTTIDESDRLYDHGKGDKHEVYTYLIGALSCDPGNIELVWRCSRAAFDLSVLKKDKEEKKELVYKAHEYALRALDLNNKHYAAHKWYAITLSTIGDYEGTTKKIENAFLVKDHFEEAIRINSKDPTTYHLLGLWHYTVADMGWYTRKAASIIFTSPPESNFEKALEYFLLAEGIESMFYKKNALYTGKTYAKLGNNTLAQ